MHVYICANVKAYTRHVVCTLYSYFNSENFLTILWTRLILSSRSFPPFRPSRISTICIPRRNDVSPISGIIVFYYPTNLRVFPIRIIQSFEGSCLLMVDPALIAYFISTSLSLQARQFASRTDACIIARHIETYSSLPVESVHCYYGEPGFYLLSEFKSDVIVLAIS